MRKLPPTSDNQKVTAVFIAAAIVYFMLLFFGCNHAKAPQAGAWLIPTPMPPEECYWDDEGGWWPCYCDLWASWLEANGLIDRHNERVLKKQ